MKKKYYNLISFSLGIVCLLFLFVPNNLQAAWEAPLGNPVGSNDVFPFILNQSGDDSSYIFDLPFGLTNDLNVMSGDLFVDASMEYVGIMNNTPQVSLDVSGVIRMTQVIQASRPLCTTENEAAIVYNTTTQRLNICINEAWHAVGYDNDDDGWLDSHDCNDADPNIYPGRLEVCDDDVDDNCDGSLTVGCKRCYEDLDGDGYGTPADIIWISQFQSCAVGWASTAGDCNESDPSINPGMDEECLDDIDNDCDGSKINGCTLCFADTDTDGYGNPAVTGYVNSGESCSVISYVSNSTDCDDSDINRNPGSEVCGNTVSDDCDALVNENCSCTSVDWSAAPSCPNMSSCTRHQTTYGTKITDCDDSANLPTRNCECICRADSWNSVSCPECGSAGTRYATLKSGYSCTDTNSTRPSIFCSAASCPSGVTVTGYSCGTGQTYLNRYRTVSSYSCVSGRCVYGSSTALYEVCDPDPRGMATGACYNKTATCESCNDVCASEYGMTGYCSWTGGWLTCS